MNIKDTAKNEIEILTNSRKNTKACKKLAREFGVFDLKKNSIEHKYLLNKKCGKCTTRHCHKCEHRFYKIKWALPTWKTYNLEKQYKLYLGEKEKMEKQLLTLQVTKEEHNRIKEKAKMAGVSMKKLIVAAVDAYTIIDTTRGTSVQ